MILILDLIRQIYSANNLMDRLNIWYYFLDLFHDEDKFFKHEFSTTLKILELHFQILISIIKVCDSFTVSLMEENEEIFG